MQSGEVHVIGQAGESLSGPHKGEAPLAIKWPGTWFGHVELLEAHGISNAEVPWRHSYIAKVPSELLLLVRYDLELLLEEFGFFRSILELEPLLNAASLSVRRPSTVFAESMLNQVALGVVGVDGNDTDSTETSQKARDHATHVV